MGDEGYLDLPDGSETACWTRRTGSEWLPIDKSHLGLIDLPRIHRDPFDRLLVAQTMQPA